MQSFDRIEKMIEASQSMDEKAQLDQLMYQEQVNVVELKEIMTYFEESGLGDDYNMTIESKDTVDTRTLSNDSTEGSRSSVTGSIYY